MSTIIRWRISDVTLGVAEKCPAIFLLMKATNLIVVASERVRVQTVCKCLGVFDCCQKLRRADNKPSSKLNYY